MFKLIRVLPFCAPPLLFSRRHPSSNYQSIHCHDSINSVKHLRIFKWLFQQRLWLLTYKSIVRELVSHFSKNITLILHKCAKRLMKSYSKSCIGSFRSSHFYSAICTKISNSLRSMLENSGEVVTPFMQGRELTRQGIFATLEPVRVTAAR
jgi:hypothetical protein